MKHSLLVRKTFFPPPHERSLQVAISVLFVSLVIFNVLPGWGGENYVFSSIQSKMPVANNVSAAIFALFLFFVILYSHRAQFYAMRPSRYLLHPEIPVHTLNVLFLIGVIPFWLINGQHSMSELWDALGSSSGVACKIMMCMCLLPIARRSVWLNAAAASYVEGIAFHRVTGWWCIAQVMIHWMSYSLKEVYLTWQNYDIWVSNLGKAANHTKPSSSLPGPQFVGGFAGSKWRAASKALEVFYWPGATRLSTTSGKEEPNTKGILVFIGLSGAFFAIALALFAIPRIRRTRYDLFYLIHLPSAALFVVLGAIHDYSIQLFIIPGLVTYFLDRTHRLTMTGFLNSLWSFTKTASYQRVNAHMRVMSDDLIGVDLIDTRDILTSEAAYGTQFLYLRVPALGLNSHPFSLAALCPSFVIRCNGDWTRRLHDLAVKQAMQALGLASRDNTLLNSEHISIEELSKVTTKIVCEIDGVYGNSSPPWRSFSHVLFIGGGVGVTPWLAVMGQYVELSKVHDSMDQSMRLVWIGRNFDDLQALGPYLPRKNTTVYLTRLAKRSFRPEDITSEESPSASRITIESNQHFVRIEPSKPWITAVTGILSLFLCQFLFYYVMGDGSYYATLANSAVSQSRYFWTKVLVVIACFSAIAITAIFTQWVSRACPCFADRNMAFFDNGTLFTPMAQLSFSEQRFPQFSNLKVKLERPDMVSLIDHAISDLQSSHLSVSLMKKGLFVAVCGPRGLVQSCIDAVNDCQKRSAVPIGLHVENTEW